MRCPLAIVEQRELARGDRPVGGARGQHALVHTFKEYDVTVDTSATTPQECAEAILAVLAARPRPMMWRRRLAASGHCPAVQMARCTPSPASLE